jgi:hypothetical protein
VFSFRRSLTIGVLAGAVLAAVSACDQLPGAAADLAVGDCFNEPAATDEVSEVQRRPCAEAHDAEVFAVLTWDRETFPIDLTLNSFIDEQCLPIFGAYTGTGFQDQDELTVGWFYPSRTSWNNGDREITCYLVRPDGEHLIGSRKVTP